MDEKILEEAFIEGKTEEECLRKNQEHLDKYPKTGMVCSLCKAPWLNGVKNDLSDEEIENWVCPNCESDLAKEEYSDNTPYGGQVERHEIEAEKEMGK